MAPLTTRGSASKRKHQWLYTLPISELEALKRGTSALRMLTDPAEKRIVSVLIREYKEGCKPPTPAQHRARLLGQCKFFLTGATGLLSSLIHTIDRTPPSDLPSIAIDAIKQDIQSARLLLEAAAKKAEEQQKILSQYKGHPTRNQRKKELI